MRLYVIMGVSEKIEFKPQCVYEINDIQWHVIISILLKKSNELYDWATMPFLQ
jgi:hypothetical protein